MKSRPVEGTALLTLGRNLALALASVCLMAPCASGAAINYAVGQPATASSSYYGDSWIGHGNDGLMTTAWVASGWDAWWQVDLGAIVPIDDVAVFNADGPGYHTTFQLSWSTDGSTWLPIGLQTTGSGPSWTFSFATAGEEMRYIRYSTIGESGSDWGALIELQAFGSGELPGQVPEPASFAMMFAGLAVVGLVHRIRHQ